MQLVRDISLPTSVYDRDLEPDVERFPEDYGDLPEDDDFDIGYDAEISEECSPELGSDGESDSGSDGESDSGSDGESESGSDGEPSDSHRDSSPMMPKGKGKQIMPHSTAAEDKSAQATAIGHAPVLQDDELMDLDPFFEDMAKERRILVSFSESYPQELVEGMSPIMDRLDAAMLGMNREAFDRSLQDAYLHLEPMEGEIDM
ncbi:serine-aspartate repeat protein F [Colletotrichum higginsianum]|nr:serine-aspartate repeat protein F [Colletotrichum higginsianum]